MTLDKLANIYEDQLLSKLYFIVEKETVYIINSKKQNFMHLTGLQRSREFKNIPKLNFFDLCKNDYRNVTELTFNNRNDKNLCTLKTDNFSYIQDALTNIKSIYINKETDIVTCSTNALANGRTFSISFLHDDSNQKFYVPFTLQVDQSLEQSNYIKPENLAKVYESLIGEKKGILEAIKIHNKAIEDVKIYVLEKYNPLAKEILKDLQIGKASCTIDKPSIKQKLNYIIKDKKQNIYKTNYFNLDRWKI